MKRYSTIVTVVALLVVGLLVFGVSSVALAHGNGPDYSREANESTWGPMMGGQTGNMNGEPRGFTNGPDGMNNGMDVWGYMQKAWRTMRNGWGGMMGSTMGGWSNMMGNGWFGGGMMGNSGWLNNGTPISAEEMHKIAEDYVASYGNELEVAEIMEFDNHFYVQAREKNTGRYAFEFLIDRYTGATHPEPGPNMMWNTKYGHMGGSGWGGMMGGGMMGGWWGQPTGETTITPEQAIQIAQDYLTDYRKGLKAADEADAFYGYYTIHIVQDGNVIGMLSVNAYTGSVWPHTWHGKYLGMVGGDEH